VTECDEFVVIGTSLNVYPAAGLVDIARNKPITIIDPNPPSRNSVTTIALPATEGVPLYIKKLLELG
jgi:NAD-dependent deacetylase